MWALRKLRRMRLNRRTRREVARLALFHLDQLRRYASPRKLANLALAKLERQLRRSDVRAMPYRYRIEPVGGCNLRCPACSAGLRRLGRPAGLMSLDHFRAVIDQIAPFALQAELYNYGEPLLHPQIVEMVRYAQGRGVAMRLSSHLNNLSRAQAAGLIEAGLSHILVAIDGATQEVYAQYRRGGSLERVLANLRMLAEERARRRSFYPFISVRVLVHRGNEHQIDAIRELAHASGADTFTTGQLYFDTTDPAQVGRWLPGDRVRASYGFSGQHRDERACAELWEHMAINWDGGVSPCCWFSDAGHVFADGTAAPLPAIWRGPAFSAARRVFGAGPQAGDPRTTCAACRGRPLFLSGQMET